MNRAYLHLEGLAVLILCLYFYYINEFSWLLFFVLLLVPDISMLGYAINQSIGAKLYNIFHTYIFPIILLISGVIFHWSIIIPIAIIWIIHIAIDRLCGFGLKYTTSFKDTHLQKV
ncbi:MULTISPECIES: DUF4260 family protein [unclassified Gracilibacillus]|uniref:DUF4260 family protein n=1 Tax=Gracilibacillus sp. JCM 18860 TaxID=1306159 RepID=UPI0006CFBF7E